MPGCIAASAGSCHNVAHSPAQAARIRRATVRVRLSLACPRLPARCRARWANSSRSRKRRLFQALSAAAVSHPASRMARANAARSSPTALWTCPTGPHRVVQCLPRDAGPQREVGRGLARLGPKPCFRDGLTEWPEDVAEFQQRLAKAVRFAPTRRGAGWGGSQAEFWKWAPEHEDEWTQNGPSAPNDGKDCAAAATCPCATAALDSKAARAAARAKGLLGRTSCLRFGHQRHVVLERIRTGPRVNRCSGALRVKAHRMKCQWEEQADKRNNTTFNHATGLGTEVDRLLGVVGAKPQLHAAVAKGLLGNAPCLRFGHPMHVVLERMHAGLRVNSCSGALRVKAH